MELNTPNKNQMPSASASDSSSTSLSQFEDSPVFNYINNLSPIDLLKSVPTNQIFSLLSLASPPSVFASPQLSSQRETTSIVKRCHFSDQSKHELPQSKDDNDTSERVSEAIEVSDQRAEQKGCFASKSSAKEVTNDPPGEELELAIELPKALKYYCESPGGNATIVNAIRTCTESKVADDSDERYCTYESEKHLRKICRNQQNKDEAGCDWVTLISDVADILCLDSCVVEEHSEEQKIVDPVTVSFISNVLHVPRVKTDDLENTEPIDCIGSSKQNEVGQPGSQLVEPEKQEADQMPAVISAGTLLNKLGVNDESANADVKGKKCTQSSCKRDKIRRRCLVFEVAGAHKKESPCTYNSESSTSSKSDCGVARMEECSTPSKMEKSNKLSKLPRSSIGLHLNALAPNSSDGKLVKIETLASGKQEINLVPSDGKDNIMENAILDVCEDFGISSPKLKRQKVDVGATCKRCNCKKSKCLKLYCECFAAGLYCIEPCSCHDCFNKPSHEDKVLETRKLIESRNPLAFAPKVIRNTDSVSEFGDESNKTPASARHKRGCNCKKSNCLKKYCECFQEGVGCTFNCRCEGCKNTFGTKNEIEENDPEGEEFEALNNQSSQDIKKKGEEECPYVLIPPQLASGQFPASSPAVGPSQICNRQKRGRRNVFGHQPKFKTHLQMIPEDETPNFLSGSLPPSSVKATSPLNKRVSPPRHGFGSSSTWRNSRKLIMRSIPPFPSLNSPSKQ